MFVFLINKIWHSFEELSLFWVFSPFRKPCANIEHLIVFGFCISKENILYLSFWFLTFEIQLIPSFFSIAAILSFQYIEFCLMKNRKLQLKTKVLCVFNDTKVSLKALVGSFLVFDKNIFNRKAVILFKFSKCKNHVANRLFYVQRFGRIHIHNQKCPSSKSFNGKKIYRLLFVVWCQT